MDREQAAWLGLAVTLMAGAGLGALTMAHERHVARAAYAAGYVRGLQRRPPECGGRHLHSV
jgi:hypothetical protein